MGQIIARAGQQIRNMEGGFRFRGLKDDGGNAADLQHTQPRNGAGQGCSILVYRNRQHIAASAFGIGDVPALFIFDLEQRPAGSLGLAGVGFVASNVVAMGGFRAVFGIGRIIIVNVIREVMSQLASGIGNGVRCSTAALAIAHAFGSFRAVLLTGCIPVGDVILGLVIMAQFGTYIGNGIGCSTAALSIADTLGGLGSVFLASGVSIGNVILGLEIVVQFRASIGDGFFCGAAALS